MNLNEFKNRILSTLQKGGASKKDISIINSILSQRIKQIEISSVALISAFILSSKNPQTKALDRDMLNKNLDRVEKIFTKAISNIESNQPPFSIEERKELVEIFNAIGLDGEKTADRFISNFDQLLGERILANTMELKMRLNSTQKAQTTQQEKRENREENVLKR
ncbi:MAG: hypothetical protein NZ908_01270 [Candidatus Micrarchaeota archaeon]|nr:hypothetical protein [Candidatus Micrarchaeota archaeon]MCX8154253.1 hypothetical protein [Candidatus Micrarchaeota archaeon]